MDVRFDYSDFYRQTSVVDHLGKKLIIVFTNRLHCYRATANAYARSCYRNLSVRPSVRQMRALW